MSNTDAEKSPVKDANTNTYIILMIDSARVMFEDAKLEVTKYDNVRYLFLWSF